MRLKSKGPLLGGPLTYYILGNNRGLFEKPLKCVIIRNLGTLIRSNFRLLTPIPHVIITNNPLTINIVLFKIFSYSTINLVGGGFAY